MNLAARGEAPTTTAEEALASETLVKRWTRRAVTIPVYCAGFAAYSATSPLWLVVGGCADLVGKDGRWSRTRALAFFWLYLACEVAGIAAAGAIWLGLLGGRVGGEKRFIGVNAALQRMWSGALFHGARSIFSMKLSVEGRALAADGPFLLFVRHSSSADTVLSAALVANPNKILLRYVLKRELLWDPCLDIVGQRLPNAFITRGKGKKRPGPNVEVEAIRSLAENLGPQDAVLIYPEGTRFSQRKLTRAIEKLREKGRGALAERAAEYRAVLPPRIAGPLSLIESAPHCDVVIIEHTGFEGAASFERFWNGALVGQTIRVRVKRIAAADVPSTHRERWLFDLWSETDAWVVAHQQET